MRARPVQDPQGPRIAPSGDASHTHGAKPPIRIVVADDQSIDRKGLIALLQTQGDLVVVAEAVSGQEAAERCREFRPDVLVLDVLMADLDVAGSIAAVRAASPATRIIAMAERGEWRCLILNPPRLVRTRGGPDNRPCGPVTDCLQIAVMKGAEGAIRRSAEPDDLFRAVRAVAGGTPWWELGTARRILERAEGLDQASGVHSLTKRELEVASLIADGSSNKETGRALGLSEPTVKKHVRSILGKLELQDRLQLALYVVRNPLLFSRRPFTR